MDVPAGRRQAAAQAAPLPGWPLLQLPAPAQRAVFQGLNHQDRHSLRLVCKAAMQLVNEAVTRLEVWMNLDEQPPAALSAVRSNSRFPCLTKLSITGPSRWLDTQQQQAALYSLKQLTDLGRWASLRQLDLTVVPDLRMAAAIACCPNLEAFSMCPLSGHSTDQSMRALMRLPHLKSVRCLAVWLTPISLEAACSMHALTSLKHECFSISGDMPHQECDFRGLAALQQLVLHRSSDDPRDGDECINEQGTCDSDDVAIHQRMRLPQSLRVLELDYWPGHASLLPHLTSLVLHQCMASDSLLAKVANACPALEFLRVKSCELSPAAHAAPLLLIASFEVAEEWHAAGDVRLPGIFPALKLLRLENCGECEHPGQLFVGASSLTCINGSCGYVYHDPDFVGGASLPLSMFGALATLPHLTTVHLNPEPAHVQGVQLLTQLTSITWTVATWCNGSEALQAAFATCSAPVHLLHAIVDTWFEASACSGATIRDVVGVADALIAWLVKAPALEHIVWRDHVAPTCGHIQLAALAMSSSVKRISINPRSDHDPYAHAHAPVSQSLDSMARFIASKQQLQLKIHATHY